MTKSQKSTQFVRPLKECTALVTGASRGVGRGIAHELGIAGATVYVTGRSHDGGQTTDDLPGTIDSAATLVTESGGRGIAVACDHTAVEDVDRLAEMICYESGRLDLLVNNVWGGYEQYDAEAFNLPLWKQPIDRWDKMFETGVRAHYLTSRAAVPLLLKGTHPLIINISFGDEGKFLGDVQYDLAKYAVTRLGFALSGALASEGISSLTVYPGFTRTERVAQGASKEALRHTHSARFVGRAVVALASDRNVTEKSGGSYKAGQLGLEYGFQDVDGSQPEPFVLS